jgi:NAD+ diphosphatase
MSPTTHLLWPANFIPLFLPDTSAAQATLHFAFVGEDLLLDTHNRLPSSDSLACLGVPQSRFVFGHIGPTHCTASAWPPGLETPPSLQAISLRNVYPLLQEGHWSLAARAKRMIGWDQTSRFCGACGTPTQALDHEPAKHCPSCQQRFYPQIAPAIMCLVHHEDMLLLARSPHFRPGMYSALAGFVEAGESVEQCVHREVFEETGVRVRNLRWFASQPWPFPQSLMLAFHAEYAGGDIVPQAGEIEDARWFRFDQLPDLPAPVSIASRLIAAGITELETLFPPSHR